jgi:RES domain-containing protein
LTIAWRLVKKQHAATALSGEGARLGGGRWNYVGISVIYASETLSLAALELFVHFTRRDIKISKSLLAIPIEIPDSVTKIDLLSASLKKGWNSSPPPDFTKDLGTRWVHEGKSVILRVPSAVVQNECNLVINPNHPDFDKITAGAAQPFSLDDRVWKK